MKKHSLFSVLLLVCISLLTAHCNRSTDSAAMLLANETSLTTLPEVLNGVSWNGVLMPDGTRTRKIAKGKVEFILPAGYKWVQPRTDGTFLYQEIGCYECKSDCNTGCDVVKLGDEIGCSSCKDAMPKVCSGKSCGGFGGASDSSGSTFAANGTFINFGAGVKLLKNREDIAAHAASPAFFLQIPEVKQAIDAFVKQAFGKENITAAELNEATHTAISVFGVALVVKVPKAYLLKKVAEDEPIDLGNGDDVKCNCTSGESGCKKEGVFSGMLRVGWKCTSGQ